MPRQAGQKGGCPSDHIQILCCPLLKSKLRENLTPQKQ